MTLKQERMAERIRIILSELLLTEVKDPRLMGVTVTEVKLDKELLFADVYVNALGDEDRRDEVMEALEHAKGFLRSEVAARVRLRRAPELHFHWDTALEYGQRIDQILDSLDIPPAADEDSEADMG